MGPSGEDLRCSIRDDAGWMCGLDGHRGIMGRGVLVDSIAVAI